MATSSLFFFSTSLFKNICSPAEKKVDKKLICLRHLMQLLIYISAAKLNQLILSSDDTTLTILVSYKYLGKAVQKTKFKSSFQFIRNLLY